MTDRFFSEAGVGSLLLSESMRTRLADRMESFCMMSRLARARNFSFSLTRKTVQTLKATSVLMSAMNTDLRITNADWVITLQFAKCGLAADEKQIRMGLEL